MNKIKIIRSCGASGKTHLANKICSIPDDITFEDARELVRIGKAIPIATSKVSSTKGEG